MSALLDLFQTARQLRSFGFQGALHLPVSSQYAHMVLLELLDKRPSGDVNHGAQIAVEFRSYGTVVLEVKEPATLN